MTKVFEICTVVKFKRKYIMVRAEITSIFSSAHTAKDSLVDNMRLVSFYDIDRKKDYDPKDEDLPVIYALVEEQMERGQYEYTEEQ